MNPLDGGCWVVKCTKFDRVEIVILTPSWISARNAAAKYFNCHVNDLRLNYAKRQALKPGAVCFTVTEALEVAGKIHGK